MKFSAGITRLGIGMALIAYSNLATAAVVPVSEPGPLGLLTMAGLALLIASQVKRNNNK